MGDLGGEGGGWCRGGRGVEGERGGEWRMAKGECRRGGGKKGDCYDALRWLVGSRDSLQGCARGPKFVVVRISANSGTDKIDGTGGLDYQLYHHVHHVHDVHRVHRVHDNIISIYRRHLHTGTE